MVPDAVGIRRFLARLDFYVQQTDEPQRQFPRGALQARPPAGWWP
jgi:hypothetical protein